MGVKEDREKELLKEKENLQKAEEVSDDEKPADSIVNEALDLLKDKANCSDEINLSSKTPDLSESSSSDHSSSSSDSSKSSKSSSDNAFPHTMEPDLENNSSEAVETLPRKNAMTKSSKRRRMAKTLTESDSDSDSDIPLSKVKEKRKRRAPQKLNDSYSGSDIFDDSDDEATSKHKRAKRMGQNKVKIIGKKVTETWSIEKEKIPMKNRRKRKPDNKINKTTKVHVMSESDEEADEVEVPFSKKGKSSGKRPPKNSAFKSTERPKRSQKVSSYVESDDELT